MRHRVLLLALALSLPAAVAEAQPAPAPAPQSTAQPAPQSTAQPARQGPPHAWAMGVWTGGVFPAGDTEGPACYANATVIVLRDVVLRVSSLDVAYRQRLIETVATTPTGQLEFRLVPPAPVGSAFGARIPPDIGFSCEGGPNILRIERQGPNEISFPDCREFPSPLKRCGAPGR